MSEKRNRPKGGQMTIYRVSTTNSELTGEQREYLVQAENVGAAEIKALRQMAKDTYKEDSKFGENYVYKVEVLGQLLK